MNKNLQEEMEQLYFGGKASDIIEQRSSTSGGVFSAIARAFLRDGGVVYGAAFDNHFSVKHIRIDDEQDMALLKGSKYVQSDLNDTFFFIKKDITGGKRILFSGTPCQIMGLKKYLSALKSVDQSLIFTCDIVCHGVPSPGMFKDYVEYLENKHSSTIVSYCFRDKTNYDWGKGRELVVFQNGQTINKPNPWGLDFYMMVYRHELIRPSCYSCHFSNTNRPGDITIGDFWGIEKAKSSRNDPNGVSLLIVNSEKGKKVLDAYRSQLNLFEVNRNDCLQPNLIEASKKKEETDLYWEEYRKGGYAALVKMDTPHLFSRVRKSLGKIKRKQKRH